MSTVARAMVASIEAAWASIRSRHPDVPDVVVTLASGSMGRNRAVRLGHFGPDRWQVGELVMPELFVGGEGLASGAQDVLCTLLHEAAHAAARARDVKDTSRAGRYHNGAYRQVAMELGLRVGRSPTSGWSVTVLPEKTAQQYLPKSPPWARR